MIFKLIIKSYVRIILISLNAPFLLCMRLNLWSMYVEWKWNMTKARRIYSQRTLMSNIIRPQKRLLTLLDCFIRERESMGLVTPSSLCLVSMLPLKFVFVWHTCHITASLTVKTKLRQISELLQMSACHFITYLLFPWRAASITRMNLSILLLHCSGF